MTTCVIIISQTITLQLKVTFQNPSCTDKLTCANNINPVYKLSLCIMFIVHT